MLTLDDVIEVEPGRVVRLRLGPASNAIRKDWRGRVAVRNVATNRLSYIPEARLVRCKARASSQPAYQWRVGDEWTKGPHRWRVESIIGDRAVLQSCSTEWARTVPLTVAEWCEDGWTRVEDR